MKKNLSITIVGLALATSLLFLSCIPMGSKTYDDLEPQDMPDNPTYESHVKFIIEEKCSLCHSSESGRMAEDISYDKYSDCIPKKGGHRGWKGIEEAAIEEKSMPPGSKERLTPKETAILLRWKEQGFVKE